MDPASLVLSLLLKNPNFAASAAKSAMAPGTINVTTMQGSLVDLAKGILTCYHKNAKFRQRTLSPRRGNVIHSTELKIPQY